MNRRPNSDFVVLQNSDKLNRIIPVAQLLVDSERPTFERGKQFVLNFISLIRGSTTAIRSTLRQVADGIKKGLVVEAFSAAYMQDARDHMKELERSDVVEWDWQTWDKKLREACDTLAEVAGTKLHNCVPNLDT